MGTAARRFAVWPGNTPPPLVWGLRNAYVSSNAVRLTTRMLITVLARLSRRKAVPAAIVAPSHAAVRIHADLGYAADKFRVIPSGVDTNRFAPDSGARQRLNEAAGIADPGALFVGLVSRWDQVKDVPGFLDAIAALPERTVARCAFLLLGSGLSESNAELAGLVARHPRKESIRMLGVRNDIAELLPGLDLAVNSSRGESLPMAVLEAMACGVPCIATDVGDTARAVGNTGRIVPPSDPAALAEAIDALLRLPQTERRTMGDASRKRILEQYDLQRSASQYAELYRSLTDST
jgi:glycosyltransferase involved in cell wall biosynthesis